jgi:hypothetical protein
LRWDFRAERSTPGQCIVESVGREEKVVGESPVGIYTSALDRVVVCDELAECVLICKQLWDMENDIAYLDMPG